jgi:hypothetical protein
MAGKQALLAPSAGGLIGQAASRNAVCGMTVGADDHERFGHFLAPEEGRIPNEGYAGRIQVA